MVEIVSHLPSVLRDDGAEFCNVFGHDWYDVQLFMVFLLRPTTEHEEWNGNRCYRRGTRLEDGLLMYPSYL